MLGGKGGLLGKEPPAGLFTIKESQDRGLADMETGSEVYMSELLVSNSTLSLPYVGWFRHGGLRRGRGVERGGPVGARGRLRKSD
jgi:hypothetical protein